MNETSAVPAFYEGDSLAIEVYDALAAQIGGPMDGDVEFYRGLARETGGPILEVGCGTGRVTTALASNGYEVVGVDLSEAMLRVAERKRASLRPKDAARLSFVHGDMTALDLERDFALVVTPSRVFQFALTTEAQRRTLEAMRQHLRPDGRLVLDLFDPLLDRVVPSADPPARGGELVHPVSHNRVTWEVTARYPDPGRQLIVEDWTYHEFDRSAEPVRTHTERLTLRWSTRSEMRLLFELAGFAVVAEYGDFHRGQPAYGREQVWLLRRVR